MKEIWFFVFFMIFMVSYGQAKMKGPCKQDAKKFCSHVKPGKGRIGQCLKKHEAELSEDCLTKRQNRLIRRKAINK